MSQHNTEISKLHVSFIKSFQITQMENNYSMFNNIGWTVGFFSRFFVVLIRKLWQNHSLASLLGWRIPLSLDDVFNVNWSSSDPPKPFSFFFIFSFSFWKSWKQNTDENSRISQFYNTLEIGLGDFYFWFSFVLHSSFEVNCQII